MSIDLPLSNLDHSDASFITDRASRIRSWLPTIESNRHPERSRWGIKFGGVVIAAIGFLITRLTVLPAVHLDVTLVQFLIGDLLPLALGLGITVVGIGITVSSLPRSYVNTLARWCVLGTLGMAVVAGIILLQVSLYLGTVSVQGVWASSIVANSLLGGAIGGILIGLRSAENKQHRQELRQHTAQSTILNRLLRHEVLNKLSVIKGYTTQLSTSSTTDDGVAIQHIDRSATRMQEAIDDVGFLTRLRRQSAASLTPVRIDEIVAEEVRNIRETHPAAEVVTEDSPSESVHVRADKHIRQVFSELFENAVQHNAASTPKVEITLDSYDRYVEIRIVDDGPGLPDDQRAVLAGGELPEYDDPSTGFGLPMVRMLVSQYDGTVAVDHEADTSDGTVITLAFPRVAAHNSDDTDHSSSAPVGVDSGHLGRATVASLVAGVAMGAVLTGLTDTLPAIGGLYGVQSVGVGWVLHLFHSVVFGLIFATAVSHTSGGWTTPSIGRCAVLGLGYGIVLWAVAAGIVMPVWLNLVGIPSSVPFLTLSSLLGHTVWGVSLGVLYGSLQP